jgi:hypothetical protein
MSILSMPERANYLEIMFLDPTKPNSLTQIETTLSESAFSDYLSKMKRHQRFKHFSKSFKTYVNAAVHMENTGHEDIKVYTKTVLDVCPSSSSEYVSVYFNKEKKPYHAFPSTSNLHAVYYTNRLSFRVNNRLYVNFDIRKYPDDLAETRHVFLNYNHDSNVDFENISVMIDNVLKTLVSAPI